MEQQEQVNTKLDAVLARQVKAQAALQGRTLKDVVCEAVADWLAKARKKAKSRRPHHHTSSKARES